MRLDYVSIFPDFFAPLTLSLPGKAAEKGLLEVGVHDLRGWTHDRHHTVDDTPYGGGAGMVMKPEPWGDALDALVVPPTTTGQRTTVVFTTPSGEPFDQRLAEELATREHLVFACGRYEGIDQRVIDHARTVAEVREVSLGDYVLNGGEVAALAITEAVVRLLPGFMGNAASLVEESHAESGLLEYPVYTKPPVWRGHEVPAVLRSGDHAKVASWRREQAVRRTAQRRPDLLTPSVLDDGTPIVRATPGDAGELLTLQRACWVQEALANDMLDIPALHESLEDVRAWLGEWDTYVVRRAGRLVAAVRGRVERGEHGDVWDIGRIMVAPDLQGSGLGRILLEHIQAVAPAEVASYVLFTGAASVRNQRMYKKAGFRLRRDLPAPPGAVVLTKNAARHGTDTRRGDL
ncbi:tRNA (guanosine(37)-N1)-methyltransferase TrmD [Nocardioides sp. BYT-33-1]|uniref:tRNA (guanosine(37)-N1)-methyltransferase TrmD n=1 Tax=Nocardioides sp. BYT-33-1 TaxID=3416952 RepID=UPI003F52FB5C